MVRMLIWLLVIFFNHITGKIGGTQGKNMASKQGGEWREHQTVHNGVRHTVKGAIDETHGTLWLVVVDVCSQITCGGWLSAGLKSDDKHRDQWLIRVVFLLFRSMTRYKEKFKYPNQGSQKVPKMFFFIKLIFEVWIFYKYAKLSFL